MYIPYTMYSISYSFGKGLRTPRGLLVSRLWPAFGGRSQKLASKPASSGTQPEHDCVAVKERK